jgi:hypothetical protein
MLLLNVLLGLNCVYLGAILSMVSLRVWYLQRQIKWDRNGLPNKKTLYRICATMCPSSYLALKILSENVDEVTMRDFVKNLEAEQCPSV